MLIAVLFCMVIVLLLKTAHDQLRNPREALVQRYIEIAGRTTALYLGTVSIEMIMPERSVRQARRRSEERAESS